MEKKWYNRKTFLHGLAGDKQTNAERHCNVELTSSCTGYNMKFIKMYAHSLITITIFVTIYWSRHENLFSIEIWKFTGISKHISRVLPLI